MPQYVGQNQVSYIERYPLLEAFVHSLILRQCYYNIKDLSLSLTFSSYSDAICCICADWSPTMVPTAALDTNDWPTRGEG